MRPLGWVLVKRASFPFKQTGKVAGGHPGTDASQSLARIWGLEGFFSLSFAVCEEEKRIRTPKWEGKLEERAVGSRGGRVAMRLPSLVMAQACLRREEEGLNLALEAWEGDRQMQRETGSMPIQAQEAKASTCLARPDFPCSFLVQAWNAAAMTFLHPTITFFTVSSSSCCHQWQEVKWPSQGWL